MDFSSNIWTQRIISPPSGVLAASLLLAWIYMGYVVVRVWMKYDKKYPPFAPGGMWEHFNIVTTPTSPWIFLDIANNHRQNRVFQLSLPADPTRKNILVGDPGIIRTILTDPTSVRPMRFYRHMRNITGGATMLTMNGHKWYAKRKAAAPAFSTNHVKRMTRVALEKTEAWIKDVLMASNNNNSSFDVGEEMLLVVLSALTETAFEYKMPSHEVKIFREELNFALPEFTRKSVTNPLRPLWCFTSERRRAQAAVKYLRKTVQHIMTTYRNKKEHLNTGTIIQLVMESDAFPTEEEKLAQLMEFLLVGHDTTAYNISWTLLCLAQHPEEQSKLRDSLSNLSQENWRNSEHLKYAIKEGMRMYPVARSVRLLGRDLMTSSGLLPKGSLCSLYFLLLFRNPDVYENPDSYLPSRWENPTREMIDAFHPFSLGTQNCVGQSLAQAETAAVVARICSEFELSVESEGTSEIGITLKPVEVRLRARKV